MLPVFFALQRHLISLRCFSHPLVLILFLFLCMMRKHILYYGGIKFVAIFALNLFGHSESKSLNFLAHTQEFLTFKSFLNISYILEHDYIWCFKKSHIYIYQKSTVNSGYTWIILEKTVHV